MTECIGTSLKLLLALLAISVASVCCEGELKQTSTTKDNSTAVYIEVGCFKDNKDRALTVKLGDWRYLHLSYSDMISNCAKAAWSKGYQGFGVQFFGECWSDEDAVRTYDKYGNNSTTCFQGIGANWANSVYFFTNTKPLIIQEPLSWKVTSGTMLNLVCDVKSPFPVNVTWYKNFDDEDPLSTGHNLTITTSALDQGYYRCKAKTPYGLGVQSKKALVVAKDYFTTIIRFRLKRNSARNRRSVKLCKPCEQIAEYLTELQLGEFSRGSCRTWTSISNQVTVECTIYRKRFNQDIADYYKSVITSLTRGARRGLPIQWNTTTIKDAEYCVNEGTGRNSFKGVFQWSLQKPGQTSTIDCPYGPRGANATRACTGDFLEGVSWNNPHEDDCEFNSKKTEMIDKLSKITVNTHNAHEVAKNLTKLFKSYKVQDLTESDARLAADTVENILAISDTLNETADLVFEVIDTILEMNKTTLAKSDETTTKIVKALDFLAENIPMNQGETTRVLKASNVVLQANDINKAYYHGISFAITPDGSIAENLEHTELSVQLPGSLLRETEKEKIRIGFIYHANNKLFQAKLDEDQKNQSVIPSEQVLSSSVYSVNTSNLHEPVTLRFPRPERADDDLPLNSSCVFWNGEERQWSDFGCSLCENNDGSQESAVECCCSHLTSFAVLFSPTTPRPYTKALASHERALSIITYVGCGISLVGVLLTFLTYSMFRHLRKTNQQPILMNLCVSIALLLILFVAGINSTNNRLGCQIVAVLLHYITLVTVLWMGIEAYNLYLQIVKVMAIYHRKFMLKAAVVGWGVPLLVVMATVIAAVVEYKQKDGSVTFYYGNDYVCVLHNNIYRIVTWFVPILAVLLFNLVTFFLVIYKLNSTGAMVPVDSKSNQRRRCWTAFAIMFLLGLTWLFGALAISDARIVFEYLFCIFNSLQGFFIFFFHCARIQEVRNQWSFFVSGLGFSHRESETSHQRSKGFGESYHASEAGFVKVRDWIQKDSDPPQRRETMLTNVSNGRDVTNNDEIDGNSNTTDKSV